MVKEDNIEIPRELVASMDDLILHFDVMYVMGLPFFTSIDGTIRYRGAVPLDSRTGAELFRALDKLLRAYNKAGFYVAEGECDGEFKCLVDETMDELSVAMNYTTPEDHENMAERNNRTIGERVRAVLHGLPFRIVPKVLVCFMVMTCTHQLNLFPAKGGVSPYYSPHALMSKRSLTTRSICAMQLGPTCRLLMTTRTRTTLVPEPWITSI